MTKKKVIKKMLWKDLHTQRHMWVMSMCNGGKGCRVLARYRPVCGHSPAHKLPSATTYKPQLTVNMNMNNLNG